MTLREFCVANHACAPGLEWLGERDLAAMWSDCHRSDWMLWLLEELCWDDAHVKRVFALWCARQVRHLLTDERSVRCLDVVKRHLRGEATGEELAAACGGAWDAVCATWDAADVAYDARAAVRAAWAAASAAAMCAAYDAETATWAAARAAYDARAAARAADAAARVARVAQANKLRELVPLAEVQRLFVVANS